MRFSADVVGLEMNARITIMSGCRRTTTPAPLARGETPSTRIDFAQHAMPEQSTLGSTGEYASTGMLAHRDTTAAGSTRLPTACSGCRAPDWPPPAHRPQCGAGPSVHRRRQLLTSSSDAVRASSSPGKSLDGVLERGRARPAAEIPGRARRLEPMQTRFARGERPARRSRGAISTWLDRGRTSTPVVLGSVGARSATRRRLMFGSDQMVMPRGSMPSRSELSSRPELGVLTEEQKRDIFDTNAVRFFRRDAVTVRGL